MIQRWFSLLLGPEITDELVKVLRKRLDETTLDIITVMLVRNCKLTPADVEVSCPCCLCVYVCVYISLYYNRIIALDKNLP